MGRVISTALQFIDGFTRPSAEAIRSLQRMGREFQKTGRQIQNAGKGISNIGSSFTKSVTLPVAGIATAAVKTAADFESAMSEVGAISGASASDMAKLTEKAKEMGATTAFSASESAEAMKYMAMAGWKTKDMTEGIAGIMNLAAASGENLGTASDIVTDALTAFNMKAKDSSRFADVLAATSSSANTNVSMMGESFKYCASTAGAMGYKVEDISVALGTMANAGIKGSTAGTTLKNVIANLSKPTDTQAALMKKLGISLTDGNGKAKSFASVMDNLRSSFAGLSETEKASAAATLAGKQSMSGLLTIVNASKKDFNGLTTAIKGSKAGKILKSAISDLSKPTDTQAALMKKLGISLTDSNGKAKSFASVMDNLHSSFAGLSEAEKKSAAATLVGEKGMSGLLKVVNASGKDFENLIKNMKGSSDAAKEMADKMLDNLNGQITLLKSAIEGILITLGDKLMPHIKNVVQWVQKAADYINNLSDAQVNNIMKWAGIAAAIGPAMMIFGKMVTTVGTVTRTFGKISTTIGNFGGVLKMITSPAGIVIGVLAAVALAAVLVVKNWDRIKPVIMNVKAWFVDAFGGTVQQAISGFKTVIKNAITVAMPMIQAISSALQTMLPAAIKTVKAVIQATIPIIQTIITTLSKILPKAIETVKVVIKSIAPVIQMVIGVVAKVAPIIASTFISVLRKLNPVIKTIGNAIKAVIPIIGKLFSNAFTFAGNTIAKVMPSINKIARTIGGVLVSAIRAVSPVITKLASTFSTVFTKVFSVVSGIVKKLQPVFNTIGAIIKTVMNVVGKVISTTFKTVADTISAVAKNIQQIIEGLVNVFNGVIDFISGVFTGNWSKAWEGVKGIFGGIFEGLVGLCKTAINAIIGLVNGAINGINSISVDIPKGIPLVGGKHIGFNIPTIPALAQGTKDWKGGIVQINEKGGEIIDLPKGSRVYPHDKSLEMARREGAKGGSITINIQKLADKIEVRNDKDIDLIAEALAYKLKQVAFNTGIA